MPDKELCLREIRYSRVKAGIFLCNRLTHHILYKDSKRLRNVTLKNFSPMATKRVVFFSALFLLVFIVTGNAQPNPDKYTAKWRSIDSLISRKGLIESALAEVNTLGALARQEKNKPQEIKALVYRLSLGQARTDSGTLFAIGHLEKELAAQDRQPARAILQ